jgi:hypothetical protein
MAGHPPMLQRFLSKFEVDCLVILLRMQLFQAGGGDQFGSLSRQEIRDMTGEDSAIDSGTA